MSSALRPVLRVGQLPSLPPSTASTTYICQSCRHARLLRRPKRPYTFTQLVTLSDGSAFTMRTTSPVPVYRSTRDTRNSPLWNPSSKELLNVEEDEAGRLAGFRARFGSGFDSVKESKKGHETADSHTASVTPPSEIKMAKEIKFEDEHNDFSEEDFNILDMISSFGQENAQQGQAASSKKGGKK
ncbi:hypothetical protein PV05_10110 [Exophiala xenobiotica]|uniref:Ribosomal protein bL31m N-terminal domain-containing protein n=1 Tax=Exophiala xenobiotica TaxID=348802 RepID=A0A0D2E7F5_9EURO|nr:uncharacterized protein PV05_10110 [Exophiala xenobiotica]KIW51383.1 hypothetical protein PV05_10110 [Exophiala xenobiotica]